MPGQQKRRLSGHHTCSQGSTAVVDDDWERHRKEGLEAAAIAEAENLGALITAQRLLDDVALEECLLEGHEDGEAHDSPLAAGVEDANQGLVGECAGEDLPLLSVLTMKRRM